MLTTFRCPGPLLVLAALAGCNSPQGAAGPLQPTATAAPPMQVDVTPTAEPVATAEPTATASGAASAPPAASTQPAPAVPATVGAACRGKDIDLAKAAIARECAVDLAAAKPFFEWKPTLKLDMTVSSKRLKEGAPIAIGLTATNATSSEQPILLTIDGPGNVAYVVFDKPQSMWRLPPKPVAPKKDDDRYAIVVLPPGGAARLKIDTQMRPMTNNFNMSCRGDCPAYVDVTWDPGAGFAPGKYELRAYVEGVASAKEWSFEVEVTK